MKIFKRIIAALIMAGLLCPAFTAFAEVETLGFDDVGYPTDTIDQYFINTVETYWVENKQADDYPDYAEMYSGSSLLVPLSVYPDRGGDAIPVTDKMVSTNKIQISSKITAGADCVGDISIVNSKKLKITGLPAGMYIEIPFIKEHAKIGRTRVLLTLVLSVNDVSYQHSRVTLRCYSRNRSAVISRNSIYGVLSPTQFNVSAAYSGEATFDFGENIKYTGKVKSNERFYMALSREPDEALAKMYPNQYIEYYDFIGIDDNFTASGRLEIPVKRANLTKNGGTGSLYVYRVDGNVLTALAGNYIVFDAKANKLTLFTSKLEKYILTNQPLLRTIDSIGENNILKHGYATENPSSSSSSSSSSSKK